MNRNRKIAKAHIELYKAQRRAALEAKKNEKVVEKSTENK